MNPRLQAELEAKHTALVSLCEKYGVASLDLFGSGTAADWQPEKSDLDFLVAFRRRSGEGLADRFLGLAEDLERLFGRPVDLLTDRGIRNPYFRRSVEQTRTSVYAA